MAKTFRDTRWRHSRSDENHADLEGIFLGRRVSRQSKDAVRDDRQRGARHRRRKSISRSRWRNRSAQLGEPLYRKMEPTGYSNANSEWVNSASLLGADEFRAGAGAEQGAGRESGPSYGSRTIPQKPRGMVLFTRSRAANARGDCQGAGGSERQRTRKRPTSGRWWRAWCSDRPIFKDGKRKTLKEYFMPTRRIFLKSSALAMVGVGATPAMALACAIRR